MLFVTETFLLFFIVVYLLFWSIPSSWRKDFLILASLFFYGTWSVPFLFHLLAVVFINYQVMEIWRRYRWKWIFITLQIANVLNIAFFKYFYLFADMVGRISGMVWLQEPNLLEYHRHIGYEIFLPLAISFYTFQIMSYGIDMVRGTYTTRHTFREVLLFKTFFPQLIAGPIMRSSELLPQLQKCTENDWKPDPDNIRRGLWLILAGVFKKMLIAEQLLNFAAPVLYNPGLTPSDYSPGSVWMTVSASMMMLYADFSAYTDLARGFGLLLGFEIPRNFKAPFFFYSMSEFWRRWHLTFSRWIRDYIFIPLGGSRVAEWRIYVNLTITFTLGGLWHGANYTFMAWGLFIGIVLAIEGALERRNYPEWPRTWPVRIIRIALSYFALVVSSVFFFASDIGWAFQAMLHMINPMSLMNPGLHTIGGVEIFWLSVVAIAFFHWADERPDHFQRLRKFDNWLLPAASLVMIITITQFAGGAKDFFYFQF